MATLAACAISSVVLAPDIPNIQSDGLEKDRSVHLTAALVELRE